MGGKVNQIEGVTPVAIVTETGGKGKKIAKFLCVVRPAPCINPATSDRQMIPQKGAH